MSLYLRQVHMPCAFQIQLQDNVATMIEDASAGPVKIIGAVMSEVVLLEPIQHGHKVALTEIVVGEAVVKYGVRMGRATQLIRRGAWVHLHNVASDFDQRSSTLDQQSGAPTDTASAYV
jgi:altronate dehydratase small subunit